MLADSSDTVDVNLGGVIVAIAKFSEQVIHHFGVQLIIAGDCHVGDAGNCTLTNSSSDIIQLREKRFFDVGIVGAHDIAKSEK